MKMKMSSWKKSHLNAGKNYIPKREGDNEKSKQMKSIHWMTTSKFPGGINGMDTYNPPGKGISEHPSPPAAAPK